MASHEGGMSVPEDTTIQPSSRDASRKRKRAKYAARACNYCQRRKIKCDGGIPCRQCLGRNRDCEGADMHCEPNELGEHAQGRDLRRQTPSDRAGSSALVVMLLDRLSQVEQKLVSLDPSNRVFNESNGSRPHDLNGQLKNGRTLDGPAEFQTRPSPKAQDPIWDDRSAFAGEASVHYSLEHMEDRLQILGVDKPPHPSGPPTPSLTPPLSPKSSSQHGTASPTAYTYHREVQNLLYSHGVVPSREQWETFLTSYFTDIHPLYPFLHPPSIWDELEKVWDKFFLNRGALEPLESEARLRLAQIFLCLASGRCTTATRTGSNGRHSAGWSLYCVATGLIGDTLNLCSNSSTPLLQLQILCLMVVYLFRLDANERAQNVLALAVSHAHSLGINRNSVLEKMPLYDKEMLKRLWWCIYVLDRRLCMETGRPFLVLDINADADQPLDISDACLSAHRLSNLTGGLDDSNLEAGVSTEDSTSPVSYLKAMIGYSRIVGKVWEAVYAAPVVKQPPNDLLREYVETLLSHWHGNLPQPFRYDDSPSLDLSDPSTSRTVIQQRFLLRMRHNYVRLMIRKPVLQPASDDLETNLTCIRLAHVIIQAFLQAPSSHGILKFPYLPYLLGATMASLSILITEPSLRQNYAEATIQASHTLTRACHESWISGKTARTIGRLCSIVRSILSPFCMARDAEDDTSAPRLASARQHRARTQQWQPPETVPLAALGVLSSPSSTKGTRNPVQGIIPPPGNENNQASHNAITGSTLMVEEPSKAGASTEQNEFVVPDPILSDLNMAEFDFEHSISGGQYLSSNLSHASMFPWDAGTEAWLDCILSATPDLDFQEFV